MVLQALKVYRGPLVLRVLLVFREYKEHPV
jgi:hypothetical protein